MPQPDRETVYQALNDLIKNALGPSGVTPTFKVVDRRVVSIGNTPPPNMPSLHQVQKVEPRIPVKGRPTIREFKVDLLIYNDFGSGKTVVPSTSLNALVTAVENVLLPNAASSFNQLGIPVSSVLLDTIEYFEGVNNVVSVAVMQVQIVANF